MVERQARIDPPVPRRSSRGALPSRIFEIRFGEFLPGRMRSWSRGSSQTLPTPSDLTSSVLVLVLGWAELGTRRGRDKGGGVQQFAHSFFALRNPCSHSNGANGWPEEAPRAQRHRNEPKHAGPGPARIFIIYEEDVIPRTWLRPAQEVVRA